MVRAKKPLFIIVGVVVAVSIFFVVYREVNWQFNRSPDMILFANEKQYKAERGAYGATTFTGGWNADTTYIPPREVVNIDGVTEIELKVVDYWQPTEIDLYLFTYPESHET